jgi:hypothetical protein
MHKQSAFTGNLPWQGMKRPSAAARAALRPTQENLTPHGAAGRGLRRCYRCVVACVPANAAPDAACAAATGAL